MAGRMSWNVKWSERPHEEAVFFNPAFCGEMIFRAVRDYSKSGKGAMPFPLTFLILPLVLHPSTRHSLPSKASTSFLAWSAMHGADVALLTKRVISLRPVTRESLLLLRQSQSITVDSNGVGLGDRPLKLTSKTLVSTVDTDQMRASAAMLGRWFAAQGGADEILQTMGIRL